MGCSLLVAVELILAYRPPVLSSPLGFSRLSLFRMLLVAVWELRMFLPESLMLAHFMDTFMAQVGGWIREQFFDRPCMGCIYRVLSSINS